MKWQDIAVHDQGNVKGFFGPYRCFSNFHPCSVVFEGITYPSTENAYMAAKTKDLDKREPLQVLSPKDAKAYGRSLKLREDWEQVKFDIMYDLNLQKYTNNADLKKILLDTRGRYLEETNWWGDVVWGVCNGKGENNLGKTLMRVRETLKQ